MSSPREILFLSNAYQKHIERKYFQNLKKNIPKNLLHYIITGRKTILFST
jgi:hypothetical protein